MRGVVPPAAAPQGTRLAPCAKSSRLRHRSSGRRPLHPDAAPTRAPPCRDGFRHASTARGGSVQQHDGFGPRTTSNAESHGAAVHEPGLRSRHVQWRKADAAESPAACQPREWVPRLAATGAPSRRRSRVRRSVLAGVGTTDSFSSLSQEPATLAVGACSSARGSVPGGNPATRHGVVASERTRVPHGVEWTGAPQLWPSMAWAVSHGSRSRWAAPRGCRDLEKGEGAHRSAAVWATCTSIPARAWRESLRV